MIDGIGHLLTLRRSGLRPRSLWLSIGGTYRRPKYAQEQGMMELCVHDSVATDDFRAFKGLRVTFFTPEWSQLAADALERLQQYADEVTVLVASYGEDIGYFWSAQHGATDMRFA